MIRSSAGNRAGGPATRAAVPDERDLLVRIGNHDLEAFEAFYRIYQPRLGRFLINMLQRPQLVEEVLDDTMMVVWQSAARFRGSSKPSTWVFAIAYRKALKAKARWPDPVDDETFDTRADPDARADEQMHRQRLHEALRQAMESLSPEHRAVVDLTYFHNLGYREIADIVNCPVDTVKTRMFHARRRLKQLLAGGLDDWLWSQDNG